MKSYIYLSILLIGLGMSSCKKKEEMKVSNNFTVTIENISQGKKYFKSGKTGLIKPGESASFSFNAGKGHYLQFGTMYVQSNDLFIAPGEEGIPLYTNGTPLTGDITGMLQLWDAGTEVNEEPGKGPNQPLRQAGPNTGMDENGTVHPVMDGFTYPAVNEVVQVMVTHDGGTGFTVTIKNISAASAIPSPLAPGTWVIHSKMQKPMFANGEKASPGLEGLAEDGNITKMDNNLSSNSGLVIPFAPGAYATGAQNDIFTVGAKASAALEALAEDGMASGFTQVFNTPEGASSPGPLTPGGKYSFTFTAEEGDNLSFALMFVQSNDWFAGVDNIALYNGSSPMEGDITAKVTLYDAGTEVDEYAGAGNNQPLRQSGPNTGMDENGKVAIENSVSDNVPSVSNMLKVTLKHD